MNNKKQSSIDFIYNAFNLLSDADFKAWMLNNYDDIKAMHRNEIDEAYSHTNNGYIYAIEKNIIISSQQYYKETFGG